MDNITIEHLIALGVVLALFLAALYYPFEGCDNDNNDFFNPSA